MALEQVKGFLGRTIRIKISDNRVIEGEFQCMDKDMNFILGEANEYHGNQDINFNVTPEVVTRFLGLVMVPGAHVLQCSVLKEETK